ncbi:MAG: flagellar basal body P-ring protein FlgI [Desulfobulbaceae bacterium]|jgi:flagellar P-ring protein precursor FlgI|nr:flagellar basal body P-ring protein FlgI [Desulfobulbaceae bacterium]
MRRFSARFFLALVVFGVIFLTDAAQAARIKDLAKLHGVRSNQLIGYGLITGLNGSGDDMKKSLFTTQAIYNMMARNGIIIDAAQMRNLKMKNIAAVMVTAQLPPFAKTGATIDAQVSSVGDASSLAGGTLLMTPLRGADGEVYAVAQGPLTIGAFSYGGKAARAQKNHPTVGNIPGGALVENTVPVALGNDGSLIYQLSDADFTTATRIAEAIDAEYGVGTAFPDDSGSVKVTIPEALREHVVEFVASIENLDVQADTAAKVVVNERTGTIVMGKDVRLSTVAVSHGNLSLVIRENKEVAQPNSFSQGETETITSTDVSVEEEEGELMLLDMKEGKNGVSIGEIASALNAIGATPRDLIAIFQAIKASGSMHGELIIL